MKLPTGGRKKKLKHRIAAIGFAVASTMPHPVAIRENRDQIAQCNGGRADSEEPEVRERQESNDANRDSDPAERRNAHQGDRATGGGPRGQLAKRGRRSRAFCQSLRAVRIPADASLDDPPRMCLGERALCLGTGRPVLQPILQLGHVDEEDRASSRA